MVMGGWKALEGVFIAALVCGGSFAGVQFLVSNYIGAELVDICSSLAAIGSLIILFKVWKPTDAFHLEGDTSERKLPPKHPTGEVITAWTPYFLLVIFVLLWGQDSIKVWLNSYSVAIEWPGLHNVVQRVAPVVAEPAPYPAIYSFAWLSAAGTACFFASVAGALVLRVTPAQFMRALGTTTKQLALPLLTISSVLGLAFLLNYCGATGTLGLAFAATGVLFPFFSALLGWIGVFLTGSDTSAKALFGNLQVVTATRLDLSPVLMASANSAGGVMGKMISLQSIAVAAAATGMSSSDEAKLFRFTLKHSVLLASLIGLLTMFYAYVLGF